MRRSKILILDDERDGAQHLKDALQLHHELTWARRIVDAIKLLSAAEADFDCIICGVHLVDENMFDFLRLAGKATKHKNVPIICFRAEDTRFARLTDQHLASSASRLGASAYIKSDEQNLKSLKAQIENAFETSIVNRR